MRRSWEHPSQTYMQLLGALAKSGVILLDEIPSNLVLAQVRVTGGGHVGLVGSRASTYGLVSQSAYRKRPSLFRKQVDLPLVAMFASVMCAVAVGGGRKSREEVRSIIWGLDKYTQSRIDKRRGQVLTGSKCRASCGKR